MVAGSHGLQGVLLVQILAHPFGCEHKHAYLLTVASRGRRQPAILAVNADGSKEQGGKILQIGTPKSIYDEPKNAFVANFIGESNIFPGTMIRDELVHFCGADFPCVDSGFGEDHPVDVVIRPEDILLVGEDVGQVTGIIKSVLFKGVHYEMIIDAGHSIWKVHSTTMQPEGSRVGLAVVPFNIHIMHRMEEEKPQEEAKK